MAHASRDVFTVMGRDPQEIGEAVDELQVSGTLRLLAGRLALSPELCEPVPRDDRVAPLPWIEDRLAGAPGCRLDLSDRGALLRDLMAMAAERLHLGSTLSDAAAEALRLRIGEALDDPGSAYRQEGDLLVARYCQPEGPAGPLRQGAGRRRGPAPATRGSGQSRPSI